MAVEQNTNESYFSVAMISLFVTMSVAFLQIGTVFTFPLVAVWIALAAGKFVANCSAIRRKYPVTAVREKMSAWGVITENHEKRDGILRTFLTWNFGSQVAIYFYTILLVVFQLTEARFLSTNIMTFINGLSAASILYLFGKRAVNVSIAALCMAWFISLIRAFVAPQFERFMKNLELHDISFGAGYILLYYIFSHKQWNRFHIAACGILTLITLLAFKRIGIAALLLTILIWAVLRYVRNQKAQRKILFWGSIAAVTLCYIFVIMLVEGWLVDILDFVGVNPKGRNYYYEALAQHCEISPWFMGLGRNASATMFTNEYAFMRVGNVHSDILRMYAECGFILFGLWLLVYWVFLPKAIDKKYGYHAAEFFILSTLYTFVVYATDNTELYLVNQYFYMLMTMHVVSCSNDETSPLGQRLVVWYEKAKAQIAAKRAVKASIQEEPSLEETSVDRRDIVE